MWAYGLISEIGFIFAKTNILKTYIPLLLLLVFSLRPVYYLGQVMYYQLNIDYIIETYCINTDKPELKCNGKCHLATQLQLDESSEDSNTQNLALIVEAFYPLFFTSVTFELKPLVERFDTTQNWRLAQLKSMEFNPAVFHPPRFI